MDKDPLSLRTLPPRRAPDGLWADIEESLDKRRSDWRPGLAAAASLVAVIGLLTALRLTGFDASESSLTQQDVLLAGARQASVQLEREVADNRSNVLTAEDALALAWIETELRLTDELLADRPKDVDLWIERTELLGEMARLYDLQDWQTQVRLASY